MGDMYCDCKPDLVAEPVEDAVGARIKEERIPVMMGGEHSVTIGAVRALAPKWYVVCDAHLDMLEEFRGSSCNHDCVTARVAETVENIVIIGPRSGTRDECSEARRRFHLYTADDVFERGMKAVLDEIAQLIGDESVYLSIDADAIDCCITPGLGTPEPFGLTPSDVRSVIRRFSKNAVGFDYVEVLPNDSGQTAIVAAHMIREFIAGHYCAHNR